MGSPCAEVAFEHRPAAGFFDTGEEAARTKEIGKEFRPVTLEEMEGRRRKARPSRFPTNSGHSLGCACLANGPHIRCTLLLPVRLDA